MHVLFIPYGNKDCVDLLMRDMQAQNFKMPFTVKATGEKGYNVQKGQIRVLPFGVLDYSFPAEYRDIVLTTLNFHEKQYYEYHGWKFKTAIKMLRKLLCIEPIPKNVSTENHFEWLKEHVNFITLGIKTDRMDLEDTNGTIHEAL